MPAAIGGGAGDEGGICRPRQRPGIFGSAVAGRDDQQTRRPDAAVKSIASPFRPSADAAPRDPQAFYTRVSERLRHKDRAIDLWDYERLVLEAFPQVYKIKCLNHTRYEPSESGTGVYRELAAGHVTIVTIPNLQQQKRDPLKPFTSLGLLEDIETFVERASSCFAQLHVKNPQFEEVRVRSRCACTTASTRPIIRCS